MKTLKKAMLSDQSKTAIFLGEKLRFLRVSGKITDATYEQTLLLLCIQLFLFPSSRKSLSSEALNP